jgi:hypothetical protein
MTALQPPSESVATIPRARERWSRLHVAWAALLVAGAVVLANDVHREVRRPPTELSIRAVASARRLDPNSQAFADAASARLGAGAVVYAVASLAAPFEGQIAVRLAYRGAPRSLATDSQWTVLERGSAAEVQAVVDALGIAYVLTQTAQPRPLVGTLCVHTAPVVQSGPVAIDAHSSYTFQIYALDRCRAQLP